MTAPLHSKSLLILLPLIAVSALVVLISLKMFLAREKAVSGYKSKEKVLTPAERSFFGALELSLGSQYRVFPKIRLADLIAPTGGADRSSFQSAFNRISAKHVDFTICRESDLAIMGVVELDDISHNQANRQARDRFLEQALQSARIPLCRVKAARTYDTAALSRQLTALLKPTAPAANLPIGTL